MNAIKNNSGPEVMELMRTHLHNLGLLFEIRMKVVIALMHGRGLARRSTPQKVGAE